VAWHALTLSLWTAAVMAVINAVMGTLTAYVLVRYSFPGKRLLNGLIDLPFAIPTLVTGVMLVVLYGPQRALGAWFDQNLGLKIIFAPPGIILALLFITIPAIFALPASSSLSIAFIVISRGPFAGSTFVTKLGSNPPATTNSRKRSFGFNASILNLPSRSVNAFFRQSG
jgi:ABC-type molybdate transport system permease subunit